jgi:hypothetical protein
MRHACGAIGLFLLCLPLLCDSQTARRESDRPFAAPERRDTERGERSDQPSWREQAREADADRADERKARSRSSRPPPSRPAAASPAPSQAKFAPPQRDEALARCDVFTREMEQVIRAEMRGGDPARMQQLTKQRQQIHLDRQRAGC